MAAIYSSLYYRVYRLPNNSTIDCAQPGPGNVWILHDIVAMNDGATTGLANGFAVVDDVNAPIFGAEGAQARLGYVYHWEGRQVLLATQYAVIKTLDPNWSFRISGYLLTA